MTQPPAFPLFSRKKQRKNGEFVSTRLEEEKSEELEEEIEEGSEDEENVDPNAGIEPPPIEYTLTELHRLAWTIQKIDEECLLTPKGSLILNSQKIMHKNHNFRGLSRDDARNLNNYLHYRTPQSFRAISNYRKVAASNVNSQFLDTLDDDLPKSSFFALFFFEGKPQK